jgi:hypothetical protein
MNAKVLLLIAASAALLAGCPDKPADKAPAPKVAASAPAPAAPAAPAPAPSAPVTAAAPMAKAAIACTGTCNVDVPVTKTADGCTVDLDRGHRIDVTANAQVTVIKWQIQGDAAFKFDSPNGIAFDKPSGAPPASVMQNGAGGGRVATVSDKHTGPATKGHWDYTIFVTDGKAKCKLDPSVDNN